MPNDTAADTPLSTAPIQTLGGKWRIGYDMRLEASSTAHDGGRRISGVPGSGSSAGTYMQGRFNFEIYVPEGVAPPDLYQLRSAFENVLRDFWARS